MATSYQLRREEQHEQKLREIREQVANGRLVIRKMTADPQFRPKTSAETLAVAQLAAKSGHARLARALLADFAARFKGDARIPAAYALKQRLSAAREQEKSA